MLAPFIDLIANVIDLYVICLTVWVILELLVYFKIVNITQTLVYRLRYALNRLILPALRPIRKFLPDLGGVDISPVVLILLLNFVKDLLYHYLYRL